jgi:hypothetical protein
MDFAEAQPCAQDLSHLKFDAYDADFNRTLAAASTLGSLDEVCTYRLCKMQSKCCLPR